MAWIIDSDHSNASLIGNLWSAAAARECSSLCVALLWCMRRHASMQYGVVGTACIWAVASELACPFLPPSGCRLPVHLQGDHQSYVHLHAASD